MQPYSALLKLANPSTASAGRKLRPRVWPRVMALAAGAVALGVSAAARADTLLYSFCSSANCADGYYPNGDLVRVGGSLIGTALMGGAYNGGAIFSITACGSPPCGETLLHTFGSIANDGSYPWSGLLRIGNTLYGTTYDGGQFGHGTVYSIRTNGTGYAVLHSFCSLASCPDGSQPVAALIAVGATLYGTTEFGGVAGPCSGLGCGTVFQMQTNGGGFQLLHSFCSSANCTDGSEPMGRLLSVNGALYGTTWNGGASGYGSVFSATPCNTANACPETALYSFGANASDGQYPNAGLVYKAADGVGYLYGTTVEGGARRNGGTVFAINPTSGAETWLFSFNGNSPYDGTAPFDDLLVKGGYLYGTTITGGLDGQGTIFKIKATGLTSESVIYAFGSGSPDGTAPVAGLTKIGSGLYGVTTEGGNVNSTCFGCGTLFSEP